MMAVPAVLLYVDLLLLGRRWLLVLLLLGEGEAADTVAVGAAVVDTVVAGTVAITKIHSVQLRRYSQLVVRA